jgi:hypothetical protein
MRGRSAMSNNREPVDQQELQNRLNDAIEARMKQAGLDGEWGTVSVVPRDTPSTGECNWTFLWENNLTEGDNIVTETVDEFRGRYDLTER